MKITAITQQKKQQNRYNVFIDGSFAFGIDGVDLLYYKLKEGLVLSQQKYDEIMEQLVFIRAREAATAYISFKQRTKKEVTAKLRGEYSEEIIEKVILLLEKYKIIDDENYARLYIKDCLNLKGWGKQRILAELYAKGISRETAEPHLENTEEILQQKAVTLVEKRLKGKIELDHKQYKKHFNFLIGRGFDFEIAKNALKPYLSDED